MYQLKGSGIRETKIAGGFWQKIESIVREDMLPFQWKALNDELPDAEPSHCIENFRIAAGEQSGEFYGCVFQDSDLGKWIEEASYTLMTHPDPKLEETIDDVIDLVGRAQRPDGYLNTYFTVKEPEGRWTNLLECHELYCAGHLMEGAVAYYEATGKRKLLDIMMGMARHIDSVLGPEEGKLPGYPGHPEIELALMRMYKVTGEEFLYKLAKFFVDARGQKPDFFDEEEQRNHSHHMHRIPAMASPRYAQHHKPVREQDSVEGHSVRVLYLLSGMIDVAAESGDPSLMRACKAMFENAVTKRMYVTGGVGSSEMGESFTLDYDLPNDTIYAETCASIALIFAANRLFHCDPRSEYGDVIERALYNTCLAGMSLDGKSFFYVNPLEVDPKKSARDPGKAHVRPHRPQWFGCACCPPNLARLLASLGQYIYAADDANVYVNLYVESATELEVGANRIAISQSSGYPYDGRIAVRLSGGRCALNLRVPEWCARYAVALNGKPIDGEMRNGFVRVEGDWQEGDEVVLDLDMGIHRVYANPRVSEDAGMAAVQRGPLIYCAEEADNGAELHRIRLSEQAEGTLESRDDLREGVVGIAFDAETLEDAGESLYRVDQPPRRVPMKLRMIPYYTWANRSVGEMRVWLRT